MKSVDKAVRLPRNTLQPAADGGYDSDSEDADEAPDGANEVKDDALQTFTAHTGIQEQAARLSRQCCYSTTYRSCLDADAVFAVAWNSAQQDVVATGGGDDTAYLWKVSHMQCA